MARKWYDYYQIFKLFMRKAMCPFSFCLHQFNGLAWHQAIGEIGILQCHVTIAMLHERNKAGPSTILAPHCICMCISKSIIPYTLSYHSFPIPNSATHPIFLLPKENKGKYVEDVTPSKTLRFYLCPHLHHHYSPHRPTSLYLLPIA